MLPLVLPLAHHCILCEITTEQRKRKKNNQRQKCGHTNAQKVDNKRFFFAACSHTMSVCQETKRCAKSMRWHSLEGKLKEAMQAIFNAVGFGGSERTYHCALFDHLCRIKHELECPHVRCSVHSETVAPIFANGDSQMPCGFVRSDIVVQWTISRKRGTKRKRASAAAAVALQKPVETCVLELKATSGQLNSAAVLQTLSYMRAHKAHRAILCNFYQRCETVQTALSSLQQDESCVKNFHFVGNALKTDDSIVMPFKPVPEIYTLTLDNAKATLQ